MDKREYEKRFVLDREINTSVMIVEPIQQIYNLSEMKIILLGNLQNEIEEISKKRYQKEYKELQYEEKISLMLPMINKDPSLKGVVEFFDSEEKAYENFKKCKGIK